MYDYTELRAAVLVCNGLIEGISGEMISVNINDPLVV